MVWYVWWLCTTNDQRLCWTICLLVASWWWVMSHASPQKSIRIMNHKSKIIKFKPKQIIIESYHIIISIMSHAVYCKGLLSPLQYARVRSKYAKGKNQTKSKTTASLAQGTNGCADAPLVFTHPWNENFQISKFKPSQREFKVVCLHNCSPDFSENKENEINSIKIPSQDIKASQTPPWHIFWQHSSREGERERVQRETRGKQSSERAKQSSGINSDNAERKEGKRSAIGVRSRSAHRAKVNSGYNTLIPNICLIKWNDSFEWLLLCLDGSAASTKRFETGVSVPNEA